MKKITTIFLATFLCVACSSTSNSTPNTDDGFGGGLSNSSFPQELTVSKTKPVLSIQNSTLTGYLPIPISADKVPRGYEQNINFF